jgi:hypothetical protein
MDARAPADNKASAFGSFAEETGRALELNECLVDLDSPADVLGALSADCVVSNTARAKQEQEHHKLLVPTLLTT